MVLLIPLPEEFLQVLVFLSKIKKILMKNFLKIIVISLICFLSITSCRDYLQVKPSDKYLKPQVFSNEKGIQTMLMVFIWGWLSQVCTEEILL